MPSGGRRTRAGRKAKGSALKAVAGDPGGRGVPKGKDGEVVDIVAKMGRPPKPSHVEANPLASEEWDRVIPHLDAMGVLAEADMAALAAYCCLYARWAAAEEKLESVEDHYYTTASGNICRHPAIVVAKECLSQMISYSAEFGLTPVARSRLSGSTGGGKGRGKLATFAKGKPKL